MTIDQQLNFERLPESGPKDETDFSLRSYVARIPEEKLAEYDPDWTDEQVMEWDGNFRNDGGLMLVCCERDVNVQDFREVLEEFLQYRQGI